MRYNNDRFILSYAFNCILDYDLCALIHMNRTTLNRKFKEQVGFTEMDYLLRHRIKIACETLTHTGLTLAEIAEAVGFKYDTYFIRIFEKKMGMSPTEYKQNEWEEVNKRLSIPVQHFK